MQLSIVINTQVEMKGKDAKAVVDSVRASILQLFEVGILDDSAEGKAVVGNYDGAVSIKRGGKTLAHRPL